MKRRSAGEIVLLAGGVLVLALLFLAPLWTVLLAAGRQALAGNGWTAAAILVAVAAGVAWFIRDAHKNP